jgi:hypothetical protein
VKLTGLPSQPVLRLQAQATNGATLRCEPFRYE